MINIPVNSWKPGKDVIRDEVVQSICNVFIKNSMWSDSPIAYFIPKFIPSTHGGTGWKTTCYVCEDLRPNTWTFNDFKDEEPTEFPYGKVYRFNETEMHNAFKELRDHGYYMFENNGKYCCSLRNWGLNDDFKEVIDFEGHW